MTPCTCGFCYGCRKPFIDKPLMTKAEEKPTQAEHLFRAAGVQFSFSDDYKFMLKGGKYPYGHTVRVKLTFSSPEEIAEWTKAGSPRLTIEFKYVADADADDEGNTFDASRFEAAIKSDPASLVWFPKNLLEVLGEVLAPNDPENLHMWVTFNNFKRN